MSFWGSFGVCSWTYLGVTLALVAVSLPTCCRLFAVSDTLHSERRKWPFPTGYTKSTAKLLLFLHIHVHLFKKNV